MNRNYDTLRVPTKHDVGYELTRQLSVSNQNIDNKQIAGGPDWRVQLAVLSCARTEVIYTYEATDAIVDAKRMPHPCHLGTFVTRGSRIGE